MKYYIAGKINGLPNYKEIFAVAEEELTKQGHLVMNPAILPEGFPYECYMPICCAMIDQCDVVYMLPNWTDSRGAKVEKAYAEATNKPVEYDALISKGLDALHISLANKAADNYFEDLEAYNNYWAKANK